MEGFGASIAFKHFGLRALRLGVGSKPLRAGSDATIRGLRYLRPYLWPQKSTKSF